LNNFGWKLIADGKGVCNSKVFLTIKESDLLFGFNIKRLINEPKESLKEVSTIVKA